MAFWKKFTPLSRMHVRYPPSGVLKDRKELVNLNLHQTMLLNGVNENALMILFQREGIQAEQQVPIKVYFEGKIIGDYVADILVENKIILEIKSVENIIDLHRAQVLNYLTATGFHLAIILNFGKEKLEFERFVK